MLNHELTFQKVNSQQQKNSFYTMWTPVQRDLFTLHPPPPVGLAGRLEVSSHVGRESPTLTVIPRSKSHKVIHIPPQ